MRAHISGALCVLPAVIFAHSAFAAPTEGATPAAVQMAGMFTNTCLKFAGHSELLRDFLREKGIRELDAYAGKAVLQNRKGVAFDLSTKNIKLVIVSEDSNACSVFLISGDNSGLIGNLHAALASRNIKPDPISDEQNATRHTVGERITVGGRPFVLVTSLNAAPKALVQAAITLSASDRP